MTAIRVTIDESLMSGSDLKIIPSMKKKILRIGGLKAKDIREAGLFLEEAGTNCNCSTLIDSSIGRRSNASYLIMGSKVNTLSIYYNILTHT